MPASITDADSIVTNINQWVQTKPRVRVDEVILDVDPDCPTMLDSFNSDDCVIEGPSNQANPISSSSPVVIIVGIAAAVAAVVVIVLIIVIFILVYYNRRKSTYRYIIQSILGTNFFKVCCIAHAVASFIENSYPCLANTTGQLDLVNIFC